MDDKVKTFGGPTDHLANERTFLAWIRTCIALMGFGFVIVKFGFFQKQPGKNEMPSEDGISAIIGIVMVALGTVMASLAYFRFRSVQKQLQSGKFSPSRWLLVTLAIGIVIASVLLVLYLLSDLKWQ